MKKNLLFLFIFFGLTAAQGQAWFPIRLNVGFNSFQYAASTSNEQMLVNDSMMYVLQYGGIYVINLNSRNAFYRFGGVYYANIIKADTGGNFLLVKNDTSLLRYHYPADTLESIPTAFNGAGITDVGRSANYTWVLINTGVVGRYNGQVWMFDTLSSAPGSHLVVKNDSVAYILAQSGGALYRLSGHTFDFAFASLNSVRVADPMDIDKAGNIWIADSTEVLKVTPNGTVVDENDSIHLLYPTQPLNVQTDNAGNVWILGYSGDLFRDSAGVWKDYTFYTSDATYIGVDKNSGVFYGFDNYLLTTFFNGVQNSFTFPNNPYSEIRAINSNYIATNQGIFKFINLQQNYFGYFPGPLAFVDSDAVSNPYIRDVTCLVNGNSAVYVDTLHSFLYGTHHGVYGLNGLIDNSQLPDTNVNYIYYNDSAFYIGTNKGLCIYKNNTYTVIDTSNAPLPSNKITFITNASDGYLYTPTSDSILYIGTDNGIAIRYPSGWQVFDTAYFHIPGAYVTGIMPAGYNYYNTYDSTIFVSTLGNGIISLKTNGNYSLYNTANGYLTNDTVYNISEQQLNTCGTWLIAAIPGAKLAFQTAYDNITDFYALTAIPYLTTDSLALKYFAAVVPNNNSWGYGPVYVYSQGSALDFTYGGCEGVANIPAPQQQLKWNYEDNTLKVWLPEAYAGPCTLNLYDLEGRTATTLKNSVSANAVVPINASQLAAGFYLLQANLNGVLLQCKVVIDR